MSSKKTFPFFMSSILNCHETDKNSLTSLKKAWSAFVGMKITSETKLVGVGQTFAADKMG